MSILTNNNQIFNYNTSILYSSDYNYNNDISLFSNSKCTIIKKNLKYLNKDISFNILKYFNCLDIFNKKTKTEIDKLKLNILSNLNNPSNTFIFFNVLTYLDTTFKEKLISYLKSHHKQIINYTNDIEETLLLDYLLLIYQDKIIIEGETKSVLKEEKIIKKLGYNLPFIVELSSGLKYYNLVSDIYFNPESLVNALWN